MRVMNFRVITESYSHRYFNKGTQHFRLVPSVLIFHQELPQTHALNTK